MGQQLAYLSDAAASVYERVSDVVGFDVARMCFTASPDVLTQTENTQIAVFTTSAAAHAALRSCGITPDVVAGHSIGEWSALVAAGAVSLEQAARAVRRRGELMGSVRRAGSMASIVGLDVDVVVHLCSEVGSNRVVVAVNNGRSNVVVSGDVDAVDEVAELAHARGCRRAVRLPVSHAFHSPLMEEIVPEWRRTVETINFGKPRLPVIVNTTGMPASSATEIERAVVDQVTATVRWRETMQYLGSLDVDDCIEVGDSKVLSGIARSDGAEFDVAPMMSPSVLRRLSRLES